MQQRVHVPVNLYFCCREVKTVDRETSEETVKTVSQNAPMRFFFSSPVCSLYCLYLSSLSSFFFFFFFFSLFSLFFFFFFFSCIPFILQRKLSQTYAPLKTALEHKFSVKDLKRAPRVFFGLQGCNFYTKENVWQAVCTAMFFLR